MSRHGISYAFDCLGYRFTIYATPTRLYFAMRRRPAMPPFRYFAMPLSLYIRFAARAEQRTAAHIEATQAGTGRIRATMTLRDAADFMIRAD